jgi:hypothetical protein
VDWYAQQDPERFLFHTSEQVTFLDTVARSITTSVGRVVKYDYCVLATGSESTLPPYIPPERAEKTKGVFVYRNISDLEKILSYSEQDHVKGGRVCCFPRADLLPPFINVILGCRCRWGSPRSRGRESCLRLVCATLSTYARSFAS